MPQAPGPYESLPDVPSFTLRSTDVAHGETLATPHLSGIFGAGGEDRSPHLLSGDFDRRQRTLTADKERYSLAPMMRVD